MLEHRPDRNRSFVMLRLTGALGALVAMVAVATADMSKLPRVEVSGSVVTVDAEEGRLTLETGDGKDVTVDVVDETRIMVAGKAGALLDVKRGSQAKVSYVEPPDKKGQRVAYQITVP